MSSYVVLGVLQPGRLAEVILSILRMQAPSSSDSPGFCAIHSLTTDGKVGLDAGLQLGVGVVMVALIALSRWTLPIVRRALHCRSCCRRRGHSQLHSLVDSSLYSSLDNDSSDGSAPPARGTTLLRIRSLSVVAAANEHWHAGASSASSFQAVHDGALLSPRVRYITTAMNFFATAYSTVTVATIKMLHCVWLPGTPVDQRRLFIRGSVVCHYSGWQAVYVVILVALISVPVVLLFVTAWAARERDARQRMQGGVWRPPSKCVHRLPLD